MSRGPLLDVRAELAGSVWKVQVAVGDVVAEGHHMLVMETMKMEIPVISESAGTVTEVHVTESTQVQEGDLLVVLEVSA